MNAVTAGCPAVRSTGRMTGSDEIYSGIAARQYGVLSLRQARMAGLTEKAVRVRLERGVLERDLPRVLRMSGSPRSWRQRIMAACLYAGPGALVSHRTAAVVWGLDGFQPGIIEISVTKSMKPPARSMVFHRFAEIPRTDATYFALLPVTTPARTLLDLGRVVSLQEVEFGLDSALRLKLASMDELWDVLRRHAKRGRGGVRCLRTLLAARAVRSTPSDSPLETRLFNLIAGSTLPLPVRQYPIIEEGVEIRRIDLAYPDERVAIEAHSFQHHFGRAAWLDDARRENFLVARGWRVLRVVDEDVRQRPRWVLDQIRRAILCERAAP